jgi:hypothetical protein
VLLDQGRQPTDEVDTDRLGRVVERLRQLQDEASVRPLRHPGDRRDGDAAVDDGNAGLGGDRASGRHEVLCRVDHPRPDILGRAAPAKVYAEGDRADVEVGAAHHSDGLEDLVHPEGAACHGSCPPQMRCIASKTE